MTVSFVDPEPNGLALLLGDLIEQNLTRDPSRRRFLQPGTVVIESIDHEVAVTLRFTSDAVEISNGVSDGAAVHIRALGASLIGLAAAPLRFGVPDALARDGRRIVAELVRGQLEVRGLVSRFPAVRRLTRLLSAR
jgi:hypothetical protein